MIVEFDLLGTHKGELRGIAPTGRSFRCRMCAFFLFVPGGDRIVCERIYFDTGDDRAAAPRRRRQSRLTMSQSDVEMRVEAAMAAWASRDADTLDATLQDIEWADRRGRHPTPAPTGLRR